MNFCKKCKHYQKLPRHVSKCPSEKVGWCQLLVRYVAAEDRFNKCFEKREEA